MELFYFFVTNSEQESDMNLLASPVAMWQYVAAFPTHTFSVGSWPSNGSQTNVLRETSTSKLGEGYDNCSQINRVSPGICRGFECAAVWLGQPRPYGRGLRSLS